MLLIITIDIWVVLTPKRSEGLMAIDICFYFQVHQPWRLRSYRYLEVGKNHSYFDEEKNAAIMRKVANKCYLPMNNILLEIIAELKGAFKIAFSISGTAIE